MGGDNKAGENLRYEIEIEGQIINHSLSRHLKWIQL